MNSAETRSRLLSRHLLVTVILAFYFMLAFGATSAFASDDSTSATSPANPSANSATSTVSPTQNSSSDRITYAETNTSLNSNNPSAPATNSAPSNNTNISAADNPYPGEDPNEKIFFGLVPESNRVYDLNNSSSATVTRDNTSNAVYVDLKSEVGQGVDLATVIDYARIGETIYDQRGGMETRITMPTTSMNDSTKEVYKNSLLVTWYEGEAPLGQGTYYSDLSEGQGTGESSGLAYYDVDARAYMYTGYSSYYPKNYFSRDTVGSDSILLQHRIYEQASYAAYESPLFFRTPGTKIITAQLTYVQEFREIKTDEEGEYTYVSFVLYASNPVIFRVNVANKQTINLNINIQARPADLSGPATNVSSGEFDVHIYKNYLDKLGIFDYDAYAYCSWGPWYQYATPGAYQVSARHQMGEYELYNDLLILEEDEFNKYLQSGSITLTIFVTPVIPTLYTVTFYTDESLTEIVQVDDVDKYGVPITDGNGNPIKVDSKQYNNGTVARLVSRPPTPTKEEDENYIYKFKRWRIYGDDGLLYYTGYQGVKEVTEDVQYWAEFTAIPKVDEPKARVVYASGGLFGKPKPAGVASYQLVEKDLSNEAKATVVESHSSEIGNKQVLGVFEVSLTQHNTNGTTESVSEDEGLDGMQLSFNVSGNDIAAGAKVKVLQIHKTGNQENPEEIIEHKGLKVIEVADEETGGSKLVVNVTLDGRLSTFIILFDEDEDGPAGEDPASGKTDFPTSEPASVDPSAEDPVDTPSDDPVDTPAAEPTDNPEPSVNPSETRNPAEQPASGKVAESKAAGFTPKQAVERVSSAVSNAGNVASAAVSELIAAGNEPASVIRAAAIDAVRPVFFEGENNVTDTVSNNSQLPSLNVIGFMRSAAIGAFKADLFGLAGEAILDRNNASAMLFFALGALAAAAVAVILGLLAFLLGRA